MHNGTIPKGFKISKVIPVYKKDEADEKSNYQTISILSNLPKNYGRYEHNEVNTYFDDILSKSQ